MGQNSIARLESKRLVVLFALALIAAVGVAACGGSNGGSNGPGTSGNPSIANVPVPQANDCLQPIQESSPIYQSPTYTHYGMHPYHWDHQTRSTSSRPHDGRRGYNTAPFLQEFPAGGLCGCEAQMYPACGPQGMICVPTTGIPNQYQVATWGYQNGQFYPGQPIQPGAPQIMNGQCASNVAQLCTVGQVNTATGAYCQPVGNGSGYGVWVQPL